jgi:hypothetical protein
MRYAKLLIPLLLVYGCATARPVEVSSGPGPIEKLYAGSGGLEGGGPVCETNSQTGISEIAIEGTGCLGPCPVYTLVLRSDGTATYMGRANTRFIGTRQGKIDPRTVEEIAKLAVDIGFFEMGDFYSCQVTDSPTIYLSIVRNETRKTIMHYAPDLSGPPRLAMLEVTLARLEELITWQ